MGYVFAAFIVFHFIINLYFIIRRSSKDTVKKWKVNKQIEKIKKRKLIPCTSDKISMGKRYMKRRAKWRRAQLGEESSSESSSSSSNESDNKKAIFFDTLVKFNSKVVPANKAREMGF